MYPNAEVQPGMLMLRIDGACGRGQGPLCAIGRIVALWVCLLLPAATAVPPPADTLWAASPVQLPARWSARWALPVANPALH